MLAGTFTLRLERSLGKPGALLYRDGRGVHIELLPYFPLRDRISDILYRESFPELYKIVHLDPFLPRCKFAGDSRIVVSQILQMALDILHGALHKVRVIYNGGHTHLVDELVPALSFPVGHVVKVQERIPTEKRGIGLLLDVRLEAPGVEFPVIGDLETVLLQTVLPVLQHACSAARIQDHGSKDDIYYTAPLSHSGQAYHANLP